MYYFFKYLGWVNITLLLLIITHFILRLVNKFGFKNKNAKLRKTSLIMSKAHPFVSILLAVTAFLHGFNLVGGIRIHSGYIAFLAILIQGLLGGLVKSGKVKGAVKIHRITGLLLAAAVIVHVILMKT
jgi:hypothetical protein